MYSWRQKKRQEQNCACSKQPQLKTHIFLLKFCCKSVAEERDEGRIRMTYLYIKLIQHLHGTHKIEQTEHNFQLFAEFNQMTFNQRHSEIICYSLIKTKMCLFWTGHVMGIERSKNSIQTDEEKLDEY